MRFLAVLQKLIAILAMLYGLIIVMSEIPETDALSSQVINWIYGIILIALSVGWLLLIDWEEEKFIHETR